MTGQQQTEMAKRTNSHCSYRQGPERPTEDDGRELGGCTPSFEGEYDAPPEEHSFDEPAGELADADLSRARALKSVGAALLGGMLSTLALPRDAQAADLKTLWAVVINDGTLKSGKGVTKVSKLSTGHYLVKFQQDVSKCAWSATRVGTSGFVFTSTVVEVNGPVREVTPREVGVTTLDRAGFADNASFHLVVIC